MALTFPPTVDTLGTLAPPGSLTNRESILANAIIALQNYVVGAPQKQTGWVTVTNAQFKALNATPVQVAAAPGAGLMRIPLAWMIYINPTVAYTAPAPTFHGHSALLCLVDDPSEFDMYQPVIDCSPIDSAAVKLVLPSRSMFFSPYDLAQTAFSVDPGGAGPYSDARSASILPPFGVNTPLYLALQNTSADFTAGDAANVVKVNVIYIDVVDPSA